ncbi:arylsulfatase [Crateriforma conspicua]|uniref:Arylsulfatase n=1 Tax=Crateriforma conspicua TaxID=2527996 RepID=A0A5C5Y258_9PLAN|nr:arylsulfatase [Crateriforma conspicua]TWT68733.1 Arylsulfatase [Crateriforma conspicua]
MMIRSAGLVTAIALMFFVVSLKTSAESSAQESGRRPNFLVIIADDLGFSDPGCYGGEIATPNLDALAAGGLRFTQFYNTARCWPTRSALMTGYYPQQIRRDSMPGAPKGFGGRGVRPQWAQTIGQYLQMAGYRTYHSGKWHIDGKPTENGFDRSDEATRGPGFFDTNKRGERDPDFYRTVATAQHAIDCLKEHSEDFAGQPFFHYLAFHAPHFPLHALPEDIQRYEGRYDDGWDQLRNQRYQRQRALGFSVGNLSAMEPDVGPPYAFPDQIELLGPGEVNRPLPWDELTSQQQRFQAMKMAIHAAMVDRMDREIGRVLDQLRAMDSYDNTIVMFLSDNGASAEMMVRGDGHDPGAAPGSAATYLCLGPGFSSAANTPFRRHKTWVHEGGISTPFIVHWPAGLEAQNEFRSAVAHVVDIAPTVLDLAGVQRPDFPGAPPMTGKSLRPLLSKDGDSLHDEIWFCHEANRALRQGDWKIVHSDKGRPFPYRMVEAGDPNESNWALYNLANDRAEQQDLADTYPAKVQAMSERWYQLRDQFLVDSSTEIVNDAKP